MLLQFLSMKDAIGDVKGKIFPNVADVITQLCATLVVILILAKFLWKPAKAYIAKRREYVDNHIKEAEIKNEEAAKLLESAQERLDKSYSEAEQIIVDAKKTATAETAVIIQKANENAKDRLNQVELEIEQAKANAKEEVKKQIVEVAILAARQVTSKNLDDKDNVQLVKDFVKDLKN